jgi:Lhr-like helicase
MDQAPAESNRGGCRIVYVLPLKALAVDVERNLRSPLAGMANMARRMGRRFTSHKSACAPATHRLANGHGLFVIPLTS